MTIRFRPRASRRPGHPDPDPALTLEPAPEYSGPAVLDAPGAEVPVVVAVSGHWDPIDGRYHWYGRVSGDRDALPDPGRTQVQLIVPGGRPATGVLSERDPWGNLRITGVGEPPFPLTAAESHS